MKYTGRPKPPLRHRHLVIVDAENLAGCAIPSPADAAASRAAVIAVIPDFGHALVIVACNHLAAPAVSWEWGTARKLWRSGPNGADLALLEVLQTEDVSRRFDRVTICSGDRIFTEIVAALAGLGIATMVVGLRGHISARLRRAAALTIELPVEDEAHLMAIA
jgi:hypothetical protein